MRSIKSVAQLASFAAAITVAAVIQNCVFQVRSDAQETEVSSEDRPAPKSMWNVPLKTAGGSQFWTDHVHREEYRIQQNVLTKHWRLLDQKDVRRAWGSREACEAVLDQLCPLKPAVASDAGGKPIVMLLHGLFRSHRSMMGLEDAIEKDEQLDAVTYSYASTRGGVAEHAAALADTLRSLPKDRPIAFVGHSMGNIVVRHLIADLQASGDPDHLLPRCKAMVMLGPPNQGAIIAKRLAQTGVFGIVTGQGGMELGPEFEKLEKHLAIPPFPFAIVAGDMSDEAIQNPLTEGAGDFVVSVEEAYLPGAADTQTFPLLHSFIMDDPDVQAYTIDFLKTHLGLKELPTGTPEVSDAN
ncbi:esterase/lipase family protein [Crateriforma conspicua]|uniref:esterase/lipase family protein n=1 Tax=Crateriforma conspicua TaxID=2527996 RepID=UPI0013FD0725|nr:alpha/beta hydrolase [Crateriforma conspicua]